MVDIMITTYNRVNFLRRTVESLVELNSVRKRVFIVDDCSEDGTNEYLKNLRGVDLEFVVMSLKRQGVVYGFNLLWNMIEYFDGFYESFPYMLYLQDDMVSQEKEWIVNIIKIYEKLKGKYNVGFFSGYDAIEHPVKEYVSCGREVQIKLSTSATMLMAEKDFWRSIGYVPQFNMDGSKRGFPGGGKGSHLDLYLTGCKSGSIFAKRAASLNCGFLQNKQVMVVPGMVSHIGVKEVESTWRNGRAVSA